MNQGSHKALNDLIANRIACYDYENYRHLLGKEWERVWVVIKHRKQNLKATRIKKFNDLSTFWDSFINFTSDLQVRFFFVTSINIISCQIFLTL